MTFTLVTTHHFERRARKFLRTHPNLKPVFADTLERLQNDPFQASLKLHGLGGTLSDIQAISLTHSYRLTLTVQITEREIVLLDIGSHDEVYR
ncbi:MAG: plasmid stabilization protein [Candidatus Competibacteraceae bacterium]|nr:MAG: plasmid stabilization protein [Candidatus Competibacteraceae bacterium]